MTTKSNEKGAFLFDKVSPGGYNLMLKDPPFGDFLTKVTLKAGEIRDVGSIPVKRKKRP